MGHNKLFYLNMNEPNYGDLEAFVVLAESENHAREIAAVQDPQQAHAWRCAVDSTCTETSLEKPGVVMGRTLE